MSGILASTEQECVVTLSHPAVGSLTFHEADGAPKDLPFALSLLAGEETSFGNPTPMVEVIESLISEGAQAYVQGWENRVFALKLRCEADSGEALSQFEDTLMRIILAAAPGSMATLRYVPPARESAPTNFDVQTLTLKRVLSDRWDLDESRRLTRYWQVEFTTLPFVRPDEPVVIEASAVPPAGEVTETAVVTPGSWTGWTARALPSTAWESPLTTSVVSGSIKVTGTTKAQATDQRLIARYDTANTAPGGLHLLYVIAKVTPNITGKPRFRIRVSPDGATPIEPIAEQALPGGWTKAWFWRPQSPSGITWTTSLGVNGYIGLGQSTGPGSSYSLTVKEIGRTNAVNLGGGTSPREQTRTLPVPGAAPTSARLAVFSDNDPGGLGETVLIHTTSDKATFLPPLRPWRKGSAAVTNDASMVSGGYNTLGTPTLWEIPTTELPAGRYVLAARLKRTTGATTRNLSWAAKLIGSGGGDVLGSTQEITGSTPLTMSGTDWKPFVLASMVLPPVALDPSETTAVRITLSMDSGGADLTLDQAWLCDVERGAFTLLSLGALAEAVTWVELRTPEIGAPFHSVYGGGVGGIGSDFAEGQDLSQFALSLGRHRFAPGAMKVFTVTSAASRSQSQGEMYARHHSHVTYGAEQAADPGE